MDCQANLTSCLGMENIDAIPIGIAYLLAAQLEDETLPEKEMFIQHCGLVDLIPASSYLSAVSETMRLEMGSERFLAEFAAIKFWDDQTAQQQICHHWNPLSTFQDRSIRLADFRRSDDMKPSKFLTES